MVLVLCWLKLCVIFPVLMQLHPVCLGRRVLMQHLKMRSPERLLTIHTVELYKSWLWQASSEFLFKQFILIKTTNFFLFTKMFFNLDKGVILLHFRLGFCGQTREVGQIAPRNLLWITLYRSSNKDLTCSGRKPQVHLAQGNFHGKQNRGMFSTKEDNRKSRRRSKEMNNIMPRKRRNMPNSNLRRVKVTKYLDKKRAGNYTGRKVQTKKQRIAKGPNKMKKWKWPH